MTFPSNDNTVDYSVHSGCSKWNLKHVEHRDLSPAEACTKVTMNVIVQAAVWANAFGRAYRAVGRLGG